MGRKVKIMLRIFTVAMVAACAVMPSAWASRRQIQKTPASFVVLAVARAEDRQVTQKLTSLVRAAQPRKGAAYAAQVATSIVKASRIYRIDPYLIAATGYCESEFNMASRPYIGIMQVSRSLARYYARLGYRYDIRTLDGNIRLGAHVLARHSRPSRLDRASLPSRGAASIRSRFPYAVGRYNGSGSSSSYTSRVMRVYATLRNGTPASWQRKIRGGGMLWR